MSEPAKVADSARGRETMESSIKSVVHLAKPGVANMGHGMVYWGPPEAALKVVEQRVKESLSGDTASLHHYGPIAGVPSFCAVLEEKLKRVNGIEGKGVMVTAGANQAFLNIVMSITSPGDSVALFAPYYFNHIMALQLCNVKPVIIAESFTRRQKKNDLEWDVDSLPLDDPSLRAVVIVSPCNPTGHVMPKEAKMALQKKCEDRGLWLISDEAYEDFVFDGAEHYSPTGANVLNVFSFSKAYGMAGWRVGYFTVPDALKESIDKVQDTVPIHASKIGQYLAEASLTVGGGRDYVTEKVETLKENRELVWDALSPLHRYSCKTQGSIYFFASLPKGVDDMKVVEHLATEYKVWILPGAGFGSPGSLRVSFANLTNEQCKMASKRLKTGISAVMENIEDFKAE